jgi:hypothetical protein
MAGGVFLIQKDESLVAMTEQPYDTEEVLQVLLAKYPDLLAGDQMDAEDPRRWLLISRETPIPVEEGGGWQFSLDHLFLDQDGVPTLVEVKRASDTRIRREVVAQMLDYAANANAYGPVKPLSVQFEERCLADGLDADQEIAARLGEAIDSQDLWDRADTNLKAGKMRLVFVADSIPPELRRIVEFLNAQMSETQVVAVEIKQYVGEGLKTLVPKVIGQTQEALDKKSTARVSREWDEPSFFAALQEQHPAGVQVARRIYKWAEESMPESIWGHGASGSFNLRMAHKGIWYQPMSMWTYGSLNFQFEYLAGKPPFDRVEIRLEFLHRLNEIPGVDLDESTAGVKPARPRVLLGALSEEGAVEKLLAELEWFVKTVRAEG